MQNGVKTRLTVPCLDSGCSLVKSCSIRILPNKGTIKLGPCAKPDDTVRESEYQCTLQTVYFTVLLFRAVT